LPASIEPVWDAVCDLRVLDAIARPIVTFEPLDPPSVPPRWEERTDRMRLRLLGIPIGWQVLGPRFPDPAAPARVLLDIGHIPLFRRWEHRVSLVPDGTHTRLTDQLSFDAGPLSRPAGLVLRLFFAHRHRQLRRLLEGDV